jgi:predicted  nucleic acid-binding Zn-ribbon protein
MSGPDQIADLRAQARHARERFDLYRAKMYGSRPTSMTRMRELERECAAAEARLRHAEREAAATGDATD